MNDSTDETTPPPTPIEPIDPMPLGTVYTAFISYRHGGADSVWARWLHQRLESYRPPTATARSWRPWKIFRDEEELAASADLGTTLRSALDQSGALIVICSRRTPESRWVAEEVAQFQNWQRGDRIFAVLIDGTPAESFPQLLLAGGVVEPLAADARSGRPRDVLLRVAAALLRVPYDDLRRRDDERRRRRRAWITTGVGVLAAVFFGLALYALNLANLADQQRLAATTAQQREQSQREIAEDRLARSILERGLAESHAGRPSAGLHALARALGLARPNTTLVAEAEALTADWGRGRGYAIPTSETTLTCAALSADAQTAAIGDERGRVSLWQMGTPPVYLGELDHGDQRIVAVTFSDDASLLAVTETYGKVSVWRMTPRERIAHLELNIANGFNAYANFASPAEVSFSPDGQLIALAWNPPINALQLFRLPDGTPVADSENYPHGVAAFRFTLDSSRVFAIDYGGFRHVVRTDDGAIDRRPTRPEGTPENAHVTLGPGALKAARYLLKKEDAGTELRDVENGAIVSERWAELDTTRAVFSVVGQRLATAHGASVRLWDARTGKALRPLIEAPAPVTALAWSRDATKIAIGDERGTVSVYAIDPGTAENHTPSHTRLGVSLRLAGRVTTLAFHPTEPWLLAVASQEARWWSWQALDPVAIEPRTVPIEWSPGGASLSRTGRGIEVRAPATQTGLRLAGDAASTGAFLADDRIAGMDESGRVRVWDAADGKIIAEVRTPALAFRVLAVDTHAKIVAVIEEKSGTIRRWALRNETLEALPDWPNPDRQRVRGAAFADQGNRLFVFARSEVELLAADDGHPVATVRVREYVTGWALTPDRQSVVVCGDKTSPMLINARTGQIEREFASDQELRGVTISPDGRTLAAIGSSDFRSRQPIVQRWWLATGSQLADLPVPTNGYDLNYLRDGRLSCSGNVPVAWAATEPLPKNLSTWLEAQTGLRRSSDDVLRRIEPAPP